MTGVVHAIRDKGLRFVAGRTPGAAKGAGRLAWARGAPGTPAAATRAATGSVTTLRHRGVGYIARDGGGGRADLFFDRAAVAGDGFAGLRVGQRVSFEEEQDPGGRDRPRAVNVRSIGEDADPPPLPPEGATG